MLLTTISNLSLDFVKLESKLSSHYDLQQNAMVKGSHLFEKTQPSVTLSSPCQASLGT